MVVQTKFFGEIEISEDKVLTFEQGLIGFEQLNKFVILYDIEKGQKDSISWLQSLDESQIAFPIINPYIVREDYNPEIEDSKVAELGELRQEDINVMLTLSVPREIEKMCCNLKAPLIINAVTKKGAQLIAENQEYPVKYYIYDILQEKRQKKEGC